MLRRSLVSTSEWLSLLVMSVNQDELIPLPQRDFNVFPLAPFVITQGVLAFVLNPRCQEFLGASYG